MIAIIWFTKKCYYKVLCDVLRGVYFIKTITLKLNNTNLNS